MDRSSEQLFKPARRSLFTISTQVGKVRFAGSCLLLAITLGFLLLLCGVIMAIVSSVKAMKYYSTDVLSLRTYEKNICIAGIVLAVLGSIVDLFGVILMAKAYRESKSRPGTELTDEAQGESPRNYQGVSVIDSSQPYNGKSPVLAVQQTSDYLYEQYQ